MSARITHAALCADPEPGTSERRSGASQLNDDPNEPGLFNAGRVQNWGDVVVEAKVVFGDGHGASAITDVMHEEGPGTSCRGFASQD